MLNLLIWASEIHLESPELDPDCHSPSGFKSRFEPLRKYAKGNGSGLTIFYASR